MNECLHRKRKEQRRWLERKRCGGRGGGREEREEEEGEREVEREEVGRERDGEKSERHGKVVTFQWPIISQHIRCHIIVHVTTRLYQI